LTSITLSNVPPHPFSETNTCGTTVPVGTSCTVNVVFNPLMAGVKAAVLDVNVGGGGGSQTVTLGGTGE
jgi:hypothetical protein